MLVPQTRTEKGIIILIIRGWCRRHPQTRTNLDGSRATHTSQVNLATPIAAGTFHVFFLSSIIFQNDPTEETETDLPVLFLLCTVISSLSLLQVMMVASFCLQCLQCFLSLVSRPVWMAVVHLSYKPIQYIYQNITLFLKLLFVFIFMHIQLNLGMFFESPSNNQLNQIPNRLVTLRVSLMCSSLASLDTAINHVSLTALELGDLYIIICRLKLSPCKRKDLEFQITRRGGWQYYNAKVGKWNWSSVINDLGTHLVFYIANLHCV